MIVETGEPARQRPRVVAAERVGVELPESARARLLEQSGARGEHAAWKDVLLDEVRLATVAFEPRVVDGDRLDHGAPARSKQRVKLFKVRGPPPFADGLEHLDRDDAVVGPRCVTVVLDPKVDPLRQAFALQAL